MAQTDSTKWVGNHDYCNVEKIYEGKSGQKKNRPEQKIKRFASFSVDYFIGLFVKELLRVLHRDKKL